ncbi:IclR family transcriptional regulator C-terminal domain-containing protein [Streptomyces sp. NPDC058745]|uniref:IclR family transcriptional regulator domain-containing protein n=1 Tax=Streptomyces sp. NPDC058745 TaxID=3346621 RepID=UPI00369FA428
MLTTVGSRFPVVSTGMGRVLLAYAPKDIQEEVLESPLRAWTPHTVTDPKALRRQLDGIRREQVFVSDRQLTEETVAVAAPVDRQDRARQRRLGDRRRGAGHQERAQPARAASARGAGDLRGARPPSPRDALTWGQASA